MVKKYLILFLLILCNICLLESNQILTAEEHSSIKKESNFFASEEEDKEKNVPFAFRRSHGYPKDPYRHICDSPGCPHGK